MRRLAFALVLGIAGVIAALALVTRPPSDPRTTVHVAGSLPNYEVAQLASYADAIALITPIGAPVTHWNSSDNEPWATAEIGIRSHIYRDQKVRVTRVIAGNPPEEEFVLRGLGGRVGTFDVRYEDDASVSGGEQYLAFLQLVDAPTREGSERVWSLVYHRHGLFHMTQSGEWANPAGKVLPAEFLN